MCGFYFILNHCLGLWFFGGGSKIATIIQNVFSQNFYKIKTGKLRRTKYTPDTDMNLNLP